MSRRGPAVSGPDRRAVTAEALMGGDTGPGLAADMGAPVGQLPIHALGPAATPRSLRRNSVARLAAEACALASGFIISAITARLLGPSGKGFYSSLLLLSGIFVSWFSAGLGDSAIVLLGQRRAAVREAAGATMATAMAFSVAGALTMFVTAHLVLHINSENDDLAIVFACVLVLIHVPALMMVAFLNSMERIVAVAAIYMAYSTVTTIGVWAFASLTNLGVAGAVLANVAGNVVMLIAILLLLARAAVPLRPRWRPGYLRPALRIGAAFQISNLLVLATGRLDLLFVYRIGGSASAGQYSVALTIGIIVGTIPLALTYASFPRLANLDEAPARALTAQVFRLGVLVVALAAAVLALFTPVVIHLLFGSAFQGAVMPSLILIVGGVFMSGQWLLSRASAARGSPAALCASFATSVLVMVALDLVLILPYGEVGAAAADVAGAVAGLAVSVWFYRGKGWNGRDFVPGRADLKSLCGVVSDALSAALGRRPSRAPGQAGPHA